ncbi:MAG TPA: hypothetical protein VIT88_04080 [Pyrinomonadaceae bacterium]
MRSVPPALAGGLRRREAPSCNSPDRQVGEPGPPQINEGPTGRKDHVGPSDLTGSEAHRGFAAAQCGKPLAYRQLPLHVCGSAARARRSLKYQSTLIGKAQPFRNVRRPSRSPHAEGVKEGSQG